MCFGFTNCPKCVLDSPIFFIFLYGLHLKTWLLILTSGASYTLVSTLANLTLVILFSEILKFWNFDFFQIKIFIVKDNNEYLGIFHLLKWKFQNEFIIRWSCVEMAKVLGYHLGLYLNGRDLPTKMGCKLPLYTFWFLLYIIWVICKVTLSLVPSLSLKPLFHPQFWCIRKVSENWVLNLLHETGYQF